MHLFKVYSVVILTNVYIKAPTVPRDTELFQPPLFPSYVPASSPTAAQVTTHLFSVTVVEAVSLPRVPCKWNHMVCSLFFSGPMS